MATSPPFPTHPDAPPAFHLLPKPTAAICNLDCEYCFFLSKEMLYRAAGSGWPTTCRDLPAAADRGPRPIAGGDGRLAGGEPTMMGLDFFRRSVELAELHRMPHQRIVYTIQTNATLIDDEWAAFSMEHDFLVGVSIARSHPRATADS